MRRARPWSRPRLATLHPFFFCILFFYVSVCVIFDVNGPAVKHCRESTCANRNNHNNKKQPERHRVAARHGRSPQDSVDYQISPRRSGPPAAKKTTKKGKTKGAMSPSRIDRAGKKTQREFQGSSRFSAAAQRAAYEADSYAGCCQGYRARICSPPDQSQT